MATVEEIRAHRYAREQEARDRAALLPPGEYHAYNNFVVDSRTRLAVCECPTHWDACLTMMAARKC